MIRYCLEFELPDDPEKASDLISYLEARRFKVMHINIHSVIVCKEYTDYGSTTKES